MNETIVQNDGSILIFDCAGVETQVKRREVDASFLRGNATIVYFETHGRRLTSNHLTQRASPTALAKTQAIRL